MPADFRTIVRVPIQTDGHIEHLSFSLDELTPNDDSLALIVNAYKFEREFRGNRLGGKIAPIRAVKSVL